MRDYSLYETAKPADLNFPIKVFCFSYQQCGQMFKSHWHEQIEILYFVKGNAVIQCDSMPIEVTQGDFIVLNSNDLHSGYNPGNQVTYYCIVIDTSLLNSNFEDTCEVKYITPIAQNLIRFENKISNDNMTIECIKNIIDEYEKKETGYELSIKSSVYRLLVLLIRNHTQKVLTLREYDSRVKNLERLNIILNHIKNNYTESIDIDNLASMIGVSTYHFYHLFKNITGKTVSEYVNHVRIDKADFLLKNTGMNITEIALSTGFNDINYFSRLFKNYKKDSPSMVRKKYTCEPPTV